MAGQTVGKGDKGEDGEQEEPIREPSSPLSKSKLPKVRSDPGKHGQHTGQARLPATFLGESQWRAAAECKLTIWDFSRQRHQFNIFDLLQQPVKDELP